MSGGVSTATHRTCRCTQAGALVQNHAKRFAIGSWCQPVTTNGPGCQPVTLSAWRSLERPQITQAGQPFPQPAAWAALCQPAAKNIENDSPMRAVTTTTGPVHIVRAFGPDE